MKNIIEKALSLGFSKAKEIEISQIVFAKELRSACEQNTCRQYGKNHACPPHIGDPDSCMAKIRQYSRGVLVQTIGNLEDSFDFEGMMNVQDTHTKMIRQLHEHLRVFQSKPFLVLGAGPCKHCESCAVLQDKPCLFPSEMISSVEAHCIDVNNTLQQVGLHYNNGENTVSFVGLVLVK